MRRALLWVACSSLLLAGGFALYLVLAYAIARPADPAAARDLRSALSIYARLLLVKGLLPQLWLALALADALERRLAVAAQGFRLAALLGGSAALAGLLVVSTLLRAEIPGSPRVAFSGPANFARAWLEMSAAVGAALWLPRRVWPRGLEPAPTRPLATPPPPC